MKEWRKGVVGGRGIVFFQGSALIWVVIEMQIQTLRNTL
jgi:hypothetical protein